MKQKKRIINFEVLRVLAMFFIVTQHYCYWGLKSSEWYHFMPMKSSMDIFNYISIEALFLISVIGVDCFVLITGYFLIDRLSFRWKGMMNIWLQTFIYGIMVSILVNNEWGGNDLPPVSFSSYWFITMYLGLIAIAPFLSLIAKNVNNNKQYRWLLVILFVMTFEYPFGRHFAGTHSLGLFVFLYLLSGYFRLHGIPSWLKLHCGKLAIGLWICLTLGIVMMNYLLVNYRGAEGYQLMADKNNNVIMFLAILVFLWFSKKNLDNRFTRLLTKLSPYTLAVYLIHQGMINNRKLWIFNIQETYTVPILLHCLLVCCLIFAVCVAIDVCRDCTFRMLRIGKIFDVIVSKLPKGLIS